MSDDLHENICPKCGQISANFDMCDTCGALLDRLRDQNFTYGDSSVPSPGLDPNAGYAPAPDYQEPTSRPWLTIIAVGILIAGCLAGGVLISNSRAREKALAQKVDAPAKEPDAQQDQGEAAEPQPASAAVRTPEAKPTEAVAAATPLIKPSPDPESPTPSSSADSGGKPRSVMNWLSSMQAAASPSPSYSSTPAMDTPPAETATPQPARATARPTAKTQEINIGEEVFIKGSQPTDKVAAVIERLQASNATPDPTAAPVKTEMVKMPVVNVHQSNFQSEVLAYSATPVLLSFFSPKVPESNAIAPAVLALSQQSTPKLKVGIVNADESKGLKQRYNISTLPTSVLVKNGKEITRFVGDLQVPAVNQAVQYSSVKNLPHFQ
ncbi:MAG: thioredoxin domain-containing protein [Candidatus Sumerlaeaceae bacterium]